MVLWVAGPAAALFRSAAGASGPPRPKWHWPRSATRGNQASAATAEGGWNFEEPGGTVVLNKSVASGNTPDNCRPAGAVPGCTN
jgi:hypothetical protein